MKFQLSSVTVFCTALLAACQSASTPEVSVEQYLKALQSNNTQLQQKFNCLQSDPPDTSTLIGMPDLKITNQVPMTTKGDSSSKYTLVLAKSSASTWEFTVWNSDNFFAVHKQQIDEVNRVTLEGHKALEASSRITGSSVPPLKMMEVPQRDQISSSKYCVLMVNKVS